MVIQPVKGTRDFYPDKMAFRDWLFKHLRAASESFGYQQYDGPFLERIDLYAAKSGEELVNEQAFVFPDRSGEMITLRPELTPSLARMIAALGNSLAKPVRWWSFGPFWRYERPQKGRTREFFQWNADLLGVPGANADAEITAVAAHFLRSIGLTPDLVRLRINNRRLADRKLTETGIDLSQIPGAFRLIDRRGKMSFPAWRDYALSLGFSKEQFNGVISLLEDSEAWQESDELVEYFSACENLGIGDYLEYDPMVIRGLDYYTGTVFEARDIDRNFRSILGGGRYDNLVADVGGNPLTGVGFAMGDVVTELVLESFSLKPDIKLNPAQVLVPTFSEELMNPAVVLSAEIRSFGYNVCWYPFAAKMSKQFKYASRENISIAAILGPDELLNGQVAIKDMNTREQTTINRDELENFLAKKFPGIE